MFQVMFFGNVPLYDDRNALAFAKHQQRPGFVDGK